MVGSVTHLAGVRYDVRDILGSIDRPCAVRAIFSEVCETGNDKGEALAVDNVPVERIDLCMSY